MGDVMISRRGFLGIVAAPAIVQVANLMPIRGERLRGFGDCATFIDGKLVAHTDFDLGAGDWTIDFWFRREDLLLDEFQIRNLDVMGRLPAVDLTGAIDAVAPIARLHGPADPYWHHIAIASGGTGGTGLS